MIATFQGFGPEAERCQCGFSNIRWAITVAVESDGLAHDFRLTEVSSIQDS
jgi:hypothetical protein